MYLKRKKERIYTDVRIECVFSDSISIGKFVHNKTACLNVLCGYVGGKNQPNITLYCRKIWNDG